MCVPLFWAISQTQNFVPSVSLNPQIMLRTYADRSLIITNELNNAAGVHSLIPPPTRFQRRQRPDAHPSGPATYASCGMFQILSAEAHACCEAGKPPSGPLDF